MAEYDIRLNDKKETFNDSVIDKTKAQERLAGWFMVEQAETILDYAAATNLTIAVGRLGEKGVSRLAEGYPARPSALQNAHVIDAAFLRTQAYRLAQVGMLLDHTMRGYLPHDNKDDQIGINKEGRREGWLTIWKEISFKPAPGAIGLNEEGGSSGLKAESKTIDQANSKESAKLIEKVLARFKSLLDPDALDMPRKSGLPRPSEIRKQKDRIRPLKAADGMCCYCFTLKVTLADIPKENGTSAFSNKSQSVTGADASGTSTASEKPKKYKRFFTELPAKGTRVRDGERKSELEVLIPVGVFHATHADAVYGIRPIDFGLPSHAFAPDSFVPGLDIRFLYAMRPGGADGSGSRRPVALGGYRRSAASELEEYIYWLNVSLARARKSVTPAQAPHTTDRDGYLFRPISENLKAFMSLPATKAAASQIYQPELQERYLSEEREPFYEALGPGLAVITPDRQIHLLSSPSQVKQWSEIHKVWDNLVVAGEPLRQSAARPNEELELEEAIPRAADYHFPNLSSVDDKLGWDNKIIAKLVPDAKKFRDELLLLEAAMTVESQINSLLQLPRTIRSMLAGDKLMAVSVWENIKSNGQATKMKQLREAQGRVLQDLERQAADVARQLLRFRAVERGRQVEGKDDRASRVELVRQIMNLVPTRRQFDKMMGPAASKDAYAQFREHLLKLEYARDLPLQVPEALNEVNRIFSALQDEGNRLEVTFSRTGRLEAFVRRQKLDKKKNAQMLERLTASNEEEASIPFAYELFRITTGLQQPVPGSVKSTFTYPLARNSHLYNTYFNYATDAVDTAGVLRKVPGVVVAAIDRDESALLKGLSMISLTGEVPCPSVFAFGSVALAENIYRGGQVHKSLRVVRRFQRRLGNEKAKIGGRKQKFYNDLITGIESKAKQLEAGEREAFESLRQQVGPEEDADSASLVMLHVLDSLEKRETGDRTRRGGRMILAATSMALLIAGIATAGAALIIAGSAVGAAKTSETILNKLSGLRHKLSQQIAIEADLAAGSAQQGNAIAIEMGFLLFLRFNDEISYEDKYLLVSRGMRYSDWYDGYAKGYTSFAKVR